MPSVAAEKSSEPGGHDLVASGYVTTELETLMQPTPGTTVKGLLQGGAVRENNTLFRCF